MKINPARPKAQSLLGKALWGLVHKGKVECSNKIFQGSFVQRKNKVEIRFLMGLSNK